MLTSQVSNSISGCSTMVIIDGVSFGCWNVLPAAGCDCIIVITAVA